MANRQKYIDSIGLDMLYRMDILFGYISYCQHAWVENCEERIVKRE